jgi:hypothetical protein
VILIIIILTNDDMDSPLSAIKSVRRNRRDVNEVGVSMRVDGPDKSCLVDHPILANFVKLRCPGFSSQN